VIAALCFALKLDYHTLMEQPDWWVDAMAVYISEKNKWEEAQSKSSKK